MISGYTPPDEKALDILKIRAKDCFDDCYSPSCCETKKFAEDFKQSIEKAVNTEDLFTLLCTELSKFDGKLGANNEYSKPLWKFVCDHYYITKQEIEDRADKVRISSTSTLWYAPADLTHVAMQALVREKRNKEQKNKEKNKEENNSNELEEFATKKACR